MEHSKKNKGKSVADILEQSNNELISLWAKLASLVMAFEGIEWKDAGDKARKLIAEKQGNSYIDEIRDIFKPPKLKKETLQKTKRTPKKKVRRERRYVNYRRLLQIAPNLEDMLISDKEVHGKSIVTGYMDFNLELINHNKRGYYLAISHYYKQNGDMIADPDMVILVNVTHGFVEALTFQDNRVYQEVYDNYLNPSMVNPKERKSQNSFLNMWLKNLINQGHLIEFEEEEVFEPISNPIENEEIETVKVKEQDKKQIPKEKVSEKEKTEMKELDLSFMDESVIAEYKEAAEKANFTTLMDILFSGEKQDISLTRPISRHFHIKKFSKDSLIKKRVSIKELEDFSPTLQDLKKDYEKLVKEQEQIKKTDNLDPETIIDDSNLANTIKHWSKLALVIRQVEGLNKEQSKEKALDLKKSGKAENYIVRAFKRNSAKGINQLFKLNFQMLLRLIPSLSSNPIKDQSGILKRKKKEDLLSVKYEGMDSISTTIHTLSFQDNEKGIQVIAVNRINKKTWLLSRYGNFDNKSDYNQEKADIHQKQKANQELGGWLKAKLHYDFGESTEQKDNEAKEKKEEEWDKKAVKKIPNFKVGKVKLVAAHIAVGLDQEDIDIINKEKKGMTITPLDDMKVNTKSFKSDMSKQALKPGFRISKTGKLYRENRSNRSDLGDNGL